MHGYDIKRNRFNKEALMRVGISVGTQHAIALWQRNPSMSATKAAALIGISHTTLLRAIKRMGLKRGENKT